MKKALKISVKVLAVVLLLLLGALFVLQIPAVQTALTQKALTRLVDKLDGEITIGSVDFRPVNSLILKDVLIVDHTPSRDTAGTGLPVVDTFARVDYVAATLSLRSLFSGNGVYLKRAYVRGGEFNLVNGKDSLGKNTSNLNRIFRLKKNDKTPEDTGNLFLIDRAEIEDFTFRMYNYDKVREDALAGKTPPRDAIDWNRLEIQADTKVRNLRYAHSIMSGTVETLSFRERSGYTAGLSGTARVGVGKTILKNLCLKDEWSDLDIDLLQLSYPDVKAFSDFLNEVRIRGEVPPSTLDLQSLSYFVPSLKGKAFKAEIQGVIDGSVSDLQIERIDFKAPAGGISGTLTGRLTGLPEPSRLHTNFEIRNLCFTTEGVGKIIRDWAPESKVDLGRFAHGKVVTFNAKGSGPLNALKVRGDLSAPSMGTAVADLQIDHLLDPHKDMDITGHLQTDELDLGSILGTDAIRQLTLETGLTASLAKAGPEIVLDSLKVSRLNALGYDYSDIWATGTYSNEAFDGRIICHDKNLNFIFQGLFNLSSTTRNAAYQFYANVGYADLNALNIDKRGKSKVSFRTKADFIYVNHEDIIGDINVADLVLENDEGRHDIGNISIVSHSNDEVNRIRLTSSFADGTYLSSRPIIKMAGDIRKLTLDKELPALSGKTAGAWNGETYDLALNFHDSRDLLSFVMPGLYIADSTAVRLNISSDGNLRGNIRSGRLAFGDQYVRRLSLDLDNSGEGLVGTFTSPEISLGGIPLHENSGSLFAEDDRIGFSYNFRNDDEENGSLYLDGSFLRDDAGALVLNARALPSMLCYNGKVWEIQSDEIHYKGKNLKINQLRAISEDQTLLVDGGYSPTQADTLSVQMEKFDLALVNSLMSKPMDIHGRATGKAVLLSPTQPQPGMIVNLVCDSTAIAGHPAGQILLESSWNDENKRFDLLLRNQLDGRNNFDISGFFKPSDRSVDVTALLDGFNIGYAAPVLTSIFSETGGSLDGKIHVSGPLKNLSISSEDAAIRDGRLRIAYTNVAYDLAGPLSLSNSGVRFQNIAVSDGQNGTGTLSGGLLFDKNFQNMRLDVQIRLREMLALDLTSAMNNIFYGTLYGSGRVSITGPFDNILIDIDAMTARPGDLHIPLGSKSSNKSMDLLTFTEPEKDLYIDPYEQMRQRIKTTGKKPSDLDVKIRVRATPDVMAYVDIGTGGGLSGQGAGTIELETRTSNNLFTINGDYTLTSGNFRFSALGLVSIDFALQDGSSVRFNGDIMDTDLNIDGRYVTKTSLANLLADENANTTRRTVNCGIQITDKLLNPQVKFSIDIPDLDPTTQTLVSSALNTEDKVQKQFIYLLLTGSFLPSEQSGIVNNTNAMLYSNVSSIMAGQLNNIFQKLDIPLDLGLNYQATQQGTEIFDVALSTQLFHNRVLVNGTIGNRQYGSAGGTGEVFGDLDIDIKLNRPGTLRLTLFSHSADKYTNYLDNSQRSGAGIAYQREFDSVLQLLRDIFTPSREQQEEERLRQRRVNYVTYQIDSTGKATLIETPKNE